MKLSISNDIGRHFTVFIPKKMKQHQVCEDLLDGGLLLNFFTTWCLKFPMLRSKALPPPSGQFNSVK